MQPIEQSYNREEKGLHGHNLQREHDTGGTPVPPGLEFYGDCVIIYVTQKEQSDG